MHRHPPSHHLMQMHHKYPEQHTCMLIHTYHVHMHTHNQYPCEWKAYTHAYAYIQGIHTYTYTYIHCIHAYTNPTLMRMNSIHACLYIHTVCTYIHIHTLHLCIHKPNTNANEKHTRMLIYTYTHRTLMRMRIDQAGQYAYAPTSAHPHTHMYTCIHTQIQHSCECALTKLVSMRTYVPTYAHTHIHTTTHVHIHTTCAYTRNMHTHTHTHIHTCR